LRVAVALSRGRLRRVWGAHPSPGVIEQTFRDEDGTLDIVILTRITSSASICRYYTRGRVLPKRSPFSALFGNAFREML
jgi:hypothetical protein